MSNLRKSELQTQKCGCAERNDDPQINEILLPTGIEINENPDDGKLYPAGIQILFPTGLTINEENADDGKLYPAGIEIINVNDDQPKRSFEEFMPVEIDTIPLAPFILSPVRGSNPEDCDGEDDDL